ncbi:hypothetical protein [Streptomyces nodosus]|uniref:hypothetical protein n=1 Tax=Streptomyces nodosus TaxID=40318 RepID=UPI0037F5AC2B
MRTRTFAMTAAAVGAAVLTTTGITYATPGGVAPAAVPLAKRVVPPVQTPAVPSLAPLAGATANANGNGNGKTNGNGNANGNTNGTANGNGNGNGNERSDEDRNQGGRGQGEDRGYGGAGGGYGGGGSFGYGGGGFRGFDRRDDGGSIQFNDRTYSGFIRGCISAASGLGSTSFSIYNDTKQWVEVYRGFTCDNGAPIATVGPYGATYGVAPSTSDNGDGGSDLLSRLRSGGLFLNDGVVGSFRVIGHHDW